MKKYLLIVLAVMMLFAVSFTATSCGNEYENFFEDDPGTFEAALAVIMEKAEGKPILIFLSKTS